MRLVGHVKLIEEQVAEEVKAKYLEKTEKITLGGGGGGCVKIIFGRDCESRGE